jgi:hypothetical protein
MVANAALQGSSAMQALSRPQVTLEKADLTGFLDFEKLDHMSNGKTPILINCFI